MTSNLKAAWNRHALPDDAPGEAADEFGLSVEEGGESKTARRIREYSEAQLGYSNRSHHISSDSKNTPDGRAAARARAADDAMRMSASIPHANWNNPATLTIGGQNYTHTQGQWHDIAKRYREKVERDIEQARARGASTDEMFALHQRQKSADEFMTMTAKENWSEDDLSAMAKHVEANADLNHFVAGAAEFGRDPNNVKTQKSEMSRGMNTDDGLQGGDVLAKLGTSTSVAAQVSDNPFAASAPDLTPIFSAVAPNTPPAPTPAEEPAPETPVQSTGLS